MKNKVAIVTGSSRGIGKAVSEKLLDQEYFVTLVSNEMEEMKTAAEKWPADKILTLVGDLANLTFARQVVNDTLTKWGQIDVLINNAAWRSVETLRTMTQENWDRTLQVCLTTPAFLAKWVGEAMEKQGRGGVMINMSSVMAGRPGGTSPAYVACKGALLSLTNELAALYGPSGIRVLAISPGNIETKLSQDFINDKGENISNYLIEDFEAHTPLLRSGQVTEVANAVSWLCSDEASYVTGMNFVIDGGFSSNFNSYPIKKIQFPDQF